MSGAEVGLVLGLISSVITIIESSQKVYDAAKDAKGLHETFRKVAKNVPLALGTLRAAEQVQRQMKTEWQSSEDGAKKKAIEETAKEIEPVFQTCKVNARALRGIFEEVVPGDEDTWLDRYIKALKTALPGKKHKVEAAVDVTKIRAGIEELRIVESSLPGNDDAKYVSSGSGPLNVQKGSGKQFNNVISGGQNNSQHIADSQTFQYGAKR